jgi:hypothetical protein
MDFFIKIVEIISNVIISISAILISMTFGIITYKIQKRQTKLQNYQLKLDLYKKRYEYYLKFRSIISPVFHDDFLMNSQKYKDLKNETDKELKFLFDEEIIENFKKIQKILDLEAGSVENNKKIQYMEQRIKYSEKLMDQIEVLLTIRNLS